MCTYGCVDIYMYVLYKYVVFSCITCMCNLLSPCKIVWTNWERLNYSNCISHYISRLTQNYKVYNKRTLYHVSTIIILITMILHTKSTCILIDLIYSCMFAPMLKWYALYKIMFKTGMHIMLIIICKHSFRIIIIVNCFIFIVLSVKIPTCIMCSHLYSITPIIMISRLCIILPRRIFVSLLLYIFCNLALNYYLQLVY